MLTPEQCIEEAEKIERIIAVIANSRGGKARVRELLRDESDIADLDNSGDMDFYALLLRQMSLLWRLAAKRDGADPAGVAALTADLDWMMVAEEIEPLVLRKYGHEVRKHARKMLRKLAKRQMSYHDFCGLEMHLDLLRGALIDSPSLLLDADKQVVDAVKSERIRAACKDKTEDVLPEITSLRQLIDLVEQALECKPLG